MMSLVPMVVTAALVKTTMLSSTRAVIVLRVTPMALITAALGAIDWAIHHPRVAIVVVAMMSLVPKVVTAAPIRTIILSSMRALTVRGVTVRIAETVVAIR